MNKAILFLLFVATVAVLVSAPWVRRRRPRHRHPVRIGHRHRPHTHRRRPIAIPHRHRPVKIPRRRRPVGIPRRRRPDRIPQRRRNQPGRSSKYEDQCAHVKCRHGYCSRGKCRCDTGWEGRRCDDRIDPCADVKCRHGNCRDGKCRCDDGWKGRKCDDRIDLCADVKCSHGYCSLGNCRCDKGWEGWKCDRRVDPCADVKCRHGYCRDGKCRCDSGWKGTKCSKEIDPCSGVKCKHGYCKGGNCRCDSGWKGTKCNKEIDPCSGVKCKHGYCKGGDCRCDSGWKGSKCNTRIDPCSGIKCKHGYCKGGDCRCNSGWKGTKCNTRIDPCADVKCKHGHCSDGKCDCNTGWKGRKCDTRIDPCLGVDCGHGYCREGHCKCDSGWSGKTCDRKKRLTSTSPANVSTSASASTLTSTSASASTSTPISASTSASISTSSSTPASASTSEPSACEEETCKNGGTCIESNGTSTCECPQGKTGTHCEKSEQCEPDPCGKNANCYACGQGSCCVCKPGMTGDPYSECSIRQAKACVSGDPHYTTYDKAHFDYQGTCLYLFTRPCSTNITDTPFFQIMMANKQQFGNSKVSYVNEIYAYVYGQIVHIGRNHNISVNRERVCLPYYYPDRQNYQFKITNHGNGAIRLHTDFFLDIEYTSTWRTCVYVPQVPDLSGNMCGLAGNMNDDPDDDLRLYDGTVVNNTDETLFGDSWVIPMEEQCLLGSLMESTKCKPEDRETARSKCEIIKKETGPFAPCKGLDFVSYMFDDCVFDMCVYKNKEEVLCTALEAFVHQCQSELPGTILDWRSPDFCPLNCSVNQHYESCANACPMTCSDHRSGANESNCTLPCIEGCTCDDGYIFDGTGDCVAPEDCGCVDSDGFYHPGNSTWLDSNCTVEYSCLDGSISNSSVSCLSNAKCQVNNGTRNCSCDIGFEGDGQTNCTDVDECIEVDMCVHGNCTNEIGGYNCTCEEDYTGQKCNKMDYCAMKPCENNGTCEPMEDYYKCSCKDGFTGDSCQYKPARHCADLVKYHHIRITGVHEGRLKNGSVISLFCDMETDGGGWTVFQKRHTGLLDFYKNWDEYKQGFGKLKKEFWMGNQLLNAILNSDKESQTLRVELTYCNGRKIYEEYENFNVGDEASGYKLALGASDGTAGDSLSKQNDAKFSTIDRDNDKLESGSCAKRHGGGGFWFEACGDASLNGKYYECEHWKDEKDGIFWMSYSNDETSAIRVQMKFRPANFTESG